MSRLLVELTQYGQGKKTRFGVFGLYRLEGRFHMLVLSTEEVAMHAKAGDRMVIKGHRVGQPDRLARILAVKGPHGEPPYLVQWSDDGHEALVYPGSDAHIEHTRARPPAGKTR